MNTATSIQLPSVYRDLVPVAGRLAIEHAALNCRIHETLLKLALLIPGEVAFLTAEMEAVHDRLDVWLDGHKVRKRKRRKGAVLRYRLGDGVLWVVSPDGMKPPPHFGSLAAVFITDAHEFEKDTLKIVDRRDARGHSRLRCLYVAGQFAGSDHWFHQFAHDRHEKWAKAPRLRRLDCDAVVKAFPDQAPLVLPTDDPRYAWAMRLRNPLPKERGAPITVFARKRLKVRSDARPEHMTERQRREVEAALAGEKWRVGTAVTVSVEFTPPQRYVLAMRRRGRQLGFRKFLLFKPRRLGATVLSQAEGYYQCLRRPKSFVASVAHKNETIERLFETTLAFVNNDPYAPALRTKPTNRTIRFDNGSRYFIGSGGAEELCRGENIQRFDGSEVTYWRHGANALGKMDRLMSGVVESARHGEIFLESTAKGVEWMCLKYREAKKKENDWWPIFVPWFFDPANSLPAGAFNETEIRDTLSAEEKVLVKERQLSPGQIAFRRAKKKEHGALFLQEFPEDDESMFISAGQMFFDPERVMELMQSLPDDAPKRRHLPGGYEIRWEEPIPGVEYVAGCDTSEGLPSSDPNGVAVLRRDTLAQVAAIHGRFRTTVLGEHAVRLCRDYNNALLGVEREYHGVAVLDRVEALGYGQPHTLGGPLFYHGETGRVGSGKRGWKTDGQTRELLIDDLEKVVKDGSMVVRDREFVSEMLTFCKQAGGRWEHDAGAHDDTIFQWGIALQMRKYRPLRMGFAFVGPARA